MTQRPTRVLHVVGSLNRGGIETWLVHVLRAIDRERFRLDILVHASPPGALADEARGLGARVIPCLHPNRPIAYSQELSRVLREQGPYDIVHSHVHHFSGHVLRVAQQAGVPVRIAHSHTDTAALDAVATLRRSAYIRLMRRLIDRHATVGLAVSQQAGAALYGPDWATSERFGILRCGIDLTPFRAAYDRAAVRSEFEFGADDFVIGHIGNFLPPKNHPFLVRLMGEVTARDPRARFLLVGDGESRPSIEQDVARAGLRDRVVFAGSRPDVPSLLCGGVDAFVLPSLYEGLALVGIEAQAAGLPAVMSDRVTREIEIVPGLVGYLSLDAPLADWAEALLGTREIARAPAAAQAAVTASPFNIDRGVERLEDIYAHGGIPRRNARAA